MAGQDARFRMHDAGWIKARRQALREWKDAYHCATANREDAGVGFVQHLRRWIILRIGVQGCTRSARLPLAQTVRRLPGMPRHLRQEYRPAHQLCHTSDLILYAISIHLAT